MAQKESQGERMEKSALPNLMPAEFAAMGKKRMEDLGKAQKEFLAKLEETNRQWFERMQAEGTMASEFSAKLTAARSIPDVATACQEWTSRHMEMAAEDAKRIFADGQKMAETGARLLSSGWLPNGKTGST